MKESDKIFQGCVVGFKDNGEPIEKWLCINDRDAPKPLTMEQYSKEQKEKK